MIKFLHAADLHLDSPFRSLPPERAAQRRGEQRALLTELADLANRRGADLLLLSGDLFDSALVGADTLDALRRALRSCRARVFIAPGNHDFCAPGSPWRGTWPENVHVFQSPTPEEVFLPELNASVWGAAFSAPTSAPLLAGFRVRDPGALNLMVLHGDAETPSSPYDPISPDEIAASGLDYLALGHIHAASGRRTAGRTVYAWPGCPMGRGFDELGEKGVYFGTLGREGCSLEFCPLPGRRYEILTVAAGDDPLAAVEAALPPDTKNDICRVVLTGEADEPDARALTAALADRFWSLSVRDETTPRRDLWAAADEDTLRGAFLRRLRAAMDAAPDAETRERCALAAKLGLAAMEGREVSEP
jgi:exonuclease SbcD